jgi:hypothetical protein
MRRAKSRGLLDLSAAILFVTGKFSPLAHVVARIVRTVLERTTNQ